MSQSNHPASEDSAAAAAAAVAASSPPPTHPVSTFTSTPVLTSTPTSRPRRPSSSPPTFSDLIAVHPLILAHLKHIAPPTLLPVSRDLYAELVPIVYRTITLDKTRAQGLFVGFLPLSHTRGGADGAGDGSRLKRPYGRYLELPERLPGRRARSSPPAVSSTSTSKTTSDTKNGVDTKASPTSNVGTSTSSLYRTITNIDPTSSGNGMTSLGDPVGLETSASTSHERKLPQRKRSEDEHEDEVEDERLSSDDFELDDDPGPCSSNSTTAAISTARIPTSRPPKHHHANAESQRYNRKARALSYTTHLTLLDAESLSTICAAHIELLSYSPVLYTHGHGRQQLAHHHAHGGVSGSGSVSGSGHNREEHKWPLRNVRTLRLGWPLIEYLADSHSPPALRRKRKGVKALPICCIPIEATTLVVDLASGFSQWPYWDNRDEARDIPGGEHVVAECGVGGDGCGGDGVSGGSDNAHGISPSPEGEVHEGYVKQTIVELASEFHLDVLEVRIRLGEDNVTNPYSYHYTSTGDDSDIDKDRDAESENAWVGSDGTNTNTSTSIPISLSELTPALAPIIRIKLDHQPHAKCQGVDRGHGHGHGLQAQGPGQCSTRDEGQNLNETRPPILVQTRRSSETRHLSNSRSNGVNERRAIKALRRWLKDNGDDLSELSLFGASTTTTTTTTTALTTGTSNSNSTRLRLPKIEIFVRNAKVIERLLWSSFLSFGFGRTCARPSGVKEDAGTGARPFFETGIVARVEDGDGDSDREGGGESDWAIKRILEACRFFEL
ncbi:hypothetical protein I317_06940 [Kwoniella heveanensis CBS 569]|nr:hypothetical protein I317_06940 [Kwoniella heveanensis CBS 569]